jgi:hypothetical protein
MKMTAALMVTLLLVLSLNTKCRFQKWLRIDVGQFSTSEYAKPYA